MVGNLTTHKKRTQDSEWLDELISILQEFRKMHSGATLSQVISFLLIAREENITQTEVLKILDADTTGQSRIITMLSKYGDRNTVGWDVIRQDENPSDRRQKLLTLTGKGRLVLSSIRERARSMCRYLENSSETSPLSLTAARDIFEGRAEKNSRGADIVHFRSEGEKK